jgi:hypothetical protein
MGICKFSEFSHNLRAILQSRKSQLLSKKKWARDEIYIFNFD